MLVLKCNPEIKYDLGTREYAFAMMHSLCHLVNVSICIFLLLLLQAASLSSFLKESNVSMQMYE